MSNYTIAVAWSGKDALSDSNPAKVISGSDFNTEFTAVQSAVNTKADLNGSATEAFSATTAPASTNTTQVATTAFVIDATSKSTMADIVYPVGSIFTTTTAYADSAAVVTVIGGTTWTAFGAGKVLVGVDSTDTDFDTVEETGGQKDAVLEAHTHTTELEKGSWDENPDNGNNNSWGPILYSNGPNQHDQVSNSTGDVLTGNENLQPYITVYMWKRTA